MATNKNAIIRYRAIDKCLQNRSRKWSLEDLITACSDALYEFEGKDTLVSKRTVQLDIQMMRSDKLGYNAPIVCYERKYYKYADYNFTITKIPLTDLDLDILKETVQMLGQFKDFGLFGEMQGVIQKLEDRVYSETKHNRPVIHMDKNDNLKGLEYLDVLYQAILKKLVLILEYKSFKAREGSKLIIHPYILKEFNNRWFLVGKRNGQQNIMTLALDRIISVEYNLNIDYLDVDFNADSYYKNTYGVTVLTDKDVADIRLKIDQENAPYVLTKPFHASQQLRQRNEDGSIIISLNIHHNFELERLILGFGDSIEVLSPRKLRNRIRRKLSSALLHYKEN